MSQMKVLIRYLFCFAIGLSVASWWVWTYVARIECDFDFTPNDDCFAYNIYYTTTEDRHLSERQHITIKHIDGWKHLSLPCNVISIRIDPAREKDWDEISDYPKLRLKLGNECVTLSDVIKMKNAQKRMHIGYSYVNESAFAATKKMNWPCVATYAFLIMMVVDFLLRLALAYPRAFGGVLIAIIAVLPAVKMSSATNHIRENRKLANFPKTDSFLFDKPNRWFNIWENAFNDRFFGRDLLVGIKGALKNAFDLPEDGRATFGKDDWLFLSSTMPDRNKSYSSNDVAGVCSFICDFDNWAKKRGKKFIFLIAPDKARVYDDKIRFRVLNGEKGLERSFADRVVESLKSRVSVVYPRQILMDQRKRVTTDLYFRHDTHWNYEGAYYGGYLPVMKMLMLEHPQFIDAWHKVSRRSEGDLIRMCANMPDKFLQEEIYMRPSYVGQRPTISDGPMGADVDSTCKGRMGCLFCYRDSFMVIPIEYFSRTFAKSHYVWRSAVRPADIPKLETSDVILFEIVERNLYWLIDKKLPKEFM